RYEVKLEKYNKLIHIETRVMKRMVRRTFLPAINKYAGELANEINACKDALVGADTNVQEEVLKQLLAGVRRITEALHTLEAACDKVDRLEDEQEKADFNAETVIPAMEELRAGVDAMEIITSRDLWPVPSYNNMLFYV
ncbi:MAG: glutamine synthetase type III, partial [Eggerthellaceae bacterium]|nr:glutamine synthetase type III [Eggerthellaceae bacterium]